MNKKLNIKAFSLIFTLLCTYSSWVFGELNMNNMPDLRTAKLHLVCSGLLEGQAPKESFDQGLCVGIILGVEDNAHFDKKICIPKNIDIKERVQVVRDYIATQPSRMDEAFASLVFDALFQKWPCKN